MVVAALGSPYFLFGCGQRFSLAAMAEAERVVRRQSLLKGSAWAVGPLKGSSRLKALKGE